MWKCSLFLLLNLLPCLLALEDEPRVRIEIKKEGKPTKTILGVYVGEGYVLTVRPPFKDILSLDPKHGYLSYYSMDMKKCAESTMQVEVTFGSKKVTVNYRLTKGPIPPPTKTVTAIYSCQYTNFVILKVEIGDYNTTPASFLWNTTDGNYSSASHLLDSIWDSKVPIGTPVLYEYNNLAYVVRLKTGNVRIVSATRKISIVSDVPKIDNITLNWFKTSQKRREGTVGSKKFLAWGGTIPTPSIKSTLPNLQRLPTTRTVKIVVELKSKGKKEPRICDGTHLGTLEDKTGGFVITSLSCVTEFVLTNTGARGFELFEDEVIVHFPNASVVTRPVVKIYPSSFYPDVIILKKQIVHEMDLAVLKYDNGKLNPVDTPAAPICWDKSGGAEDFKNLLIVQTGPFEGNDKPITGGTHFFGQVEARHESSFLRGILSLDEKARTGNPGSGVMHTPDGEYQCLIAVRSGDPLEEGKYGLCSVLNDEGVQNWLKEIGVKNVQIAAKLRTGDKDILTPDATRFDLSPVVNSYVVKIQILIPGQQSPITFEGNHVGAGYILTSKTGFKKVMEFVPAGMREPVGHYYKESMDQFNKLGIEIFVDGIAENESFRFRVTHLYRKKGAGANADYSNVKGDGIFVLKIDMRIEVGLKEYIYPKLEHICLPLPYRLETSTFPTANCPKESCKLSLKNWQDRKPGVMSYLQNFEFPVSGNAIADSTISGSEFTGVYDGLDKKVFSDGSGAIYEGHSSKIKFLAGVAIENSGLVAENQAAMAVTKKIKINGYYFNRLGFDLIEFFRTTLESEMSGINESCQHECPQAHNIQVQGFGVVTSKTLNIQCPGTFLGVGMPESTSANPTPTPTGYLITSETCLTGAVNKRLSAEDEIKGGDFKVFVNVRDAKDVVTVQEFKVIEINLGRSHIPDTYNIGIVKFEVPGGVGIRRSGVCLCWKTESIYENQEAFNFRSNIFMVDVNGAPVEGGKSNVLDVIRRPICTKADYSENKLFHTFHKSGTECPNVGGGGQNGSPVLKHHENKFCLSAVHSTKPDPIGLPIPILEPAKKEDFEKKLNELLVSKGPGAAQSMARLPNESSYSWNQRLKTGSSEAFAVYLELLKNEFGLEVNSKLTADAIKWIGEIDRSLLKTIQSGMGCFQTTSTTTDSLKTSGPTNSLKSSISNSIKSSTSTDSLKTSTPTIGPTPPVATLPPANTEKKPPKYYYPPKSTPKNPRPATEPKLAWQISATLKVGLAVVDAAAK